MTRPKPQTLGEIIGDWLETVLRQKIFEWIGPLGRAFNMPRGFAFAGDFAVRTFEDQTEDLALTPDDLAQAQAVLTPARRNDAGDTSTYQEGRTQLRSLLYLVDHCVILGHSMTVLDQKSSMALARTAGPLLPDMATPARLKRRAAPAGACYTLSCQGDFALFFKNDILPLLHFLGAYGAEIGPLHIVTRPDFPPFVRDTLQAICAAHPGVEILDLAINERLENVRVLWLSRTPDASDWDGLTREEADALAAILRAYYQLPPPAEPDQLLFVSRGRAIMGALSNEAEVFTTLMDFGFEFYAPRADDLKSQIEAFQSARVIVAAHGEGLANLIFCQPGTLVIELFPSDRVRSVYCWLALRLGLRYRAVMGFQADAMQAFFVKLHELIPQLEAELGPLPEDEEESDEDDESEAGDTA